MTTAIATLLLCSVVLAWTLFPLWVKSLDRDPGDGLEKDDRVTKWREEKDRLVAEMVSLDVAITERKIDRESYDNERARVMAEAESAVEELRKARAGASERKNAARTYPLLGGALAGVVAIGAITLTVALDSNDLRTDASPHASGQIPLSPEQMAAGMPDGAKPMPNMPNPHVAAGQAGPPLGPDGTPDVGAMVAKLEAKVQAGGASLDEVMMLARSYRVLGREAESLAMYRRASDMAPDEPQLALVLASALLRSDSETDRSEAERIVDKALDTEPSKPEALWLKSIGLIRRHDIEPAKEILGKLQSIVGENSEARAAVSGLLAELNNAQIPADAPPSKADADSLGVSPPPAGDTSSSRPVAPTDAAP